MSSKRRIRRRQCEGKVRHQTLAAAQFHADNLNRAGRSGKEAYYCRFCGGFHVGNPIGHKVYDPTLRHGRRS